MTQAKTASCRHAPPTDAGSPRPATRLRIMCRKAWGFESPLPQATEATNVLVQKSTAKRSDVCAERGSIHRALASGGFSQGKLDQFSQGQVGSLPTNKFTREGGADGYLG